MDWAESAQATFKAEVTRSVCDTEMGYAQECPGRTVRVTPGDQPGGNCRSGLLEGQQNGSGQSAVGDGMGDCEGSDVCKPGHDELRGGSTM